MLVLWIIAFILAALYFIWIGLFYYGWAKIPSYSSMTCHERNFVSILIPARNEEINLLGLLDNLIKQKYPQNLIEIIVIDDHSSDLTEEIVEYFAKRNSNIRYVKLGNYEEGKKTALRKGVSAARFSYILTIDADCRPTPLWIRSMVDCFEKTRADLIAGPVVMEDGGGFFNRFQRLEFFSLLGSTAGSLGTGNPVMCSSANLGFRKDAYMEVRNKNHREVSSGDDVFLLLAMHKTGMKKLLFLKSSDAYVTTRGENNLAGFLKQRQRWASKSRYYNSTASVFTAVLVFMINLYASGCLFLGIFFNPFLLIAAFLFVIKSLIDFPFLFSVTSFFGEKKLMRFFIPVQIVYLFYVSFTAITAFTGVFDWKGRIVKN